MDVLLRDLDPVIIKKIDEMAKKNNQSRQIYLKKHIELLATDYIQSEKMSHLEKQLQANTLALKNVSETMDTMNLIIQELTEGD